MMPSVLLQSRLRQRGTARLYRVVWDSDGSGLLEFALAISALLIAILGILYGSLALYADHYVVTAARDGARYAMVRGSTWGGVACASAASYSCTATNTSVRTYLLSLAPLGLKPSNMTVVTAWPGLSAAGSACYLLSGVNGPGCSVTVTVTYTFDLSLPLMPKKTLQLASSSTMPITQ
jgi:Flp pilus assembly protein TadG